MKTILKHLGRPTGGFSEKKVTTSLEPIAKRRQIDEARVTIANHPEHSPSYVVTMHLVTPGPDLFAQARDHTPDAALRKTLAKLEEGIQQREAKRAVKNRPTGSVRRPTKSQPRLAS